MSEINRLNTRNAAISAMLLDSENIKNFYRFIAQNPHINLHDACQIVIERPNATVCFSFDEWDAMGRRISKGRKGIAYYDYDGYKQYVFDVNDTHGDRRYLRPILPMKHLLVGLDELNITNYADDERSDYRKIHKGVQLYLKEQGELTGDDKKDGLKIEGIAYMLYCKTGFPKTAGIAFHGLPYSFKENTDFVKDLYILTDTIVEEIENAYQSRQQQPVKVIDDINEETISDEPTVSKPLIEQVSDLTEQIDDLTESIPVEQTKVQPEQDVKSVEQMDTSKLPPYYREYLKQERENPNRIIAIRVGDFYEFMNESAKTISQELDLTLTGRDVGLPERVPMCGVPFHATEKYFNKILANHELVVIEDYTKKSINIFPSEEEKQDERDKPELIEIEDNEPNPFDSEEDGKFRIFDKYNENPTVKTFVEFLKKEYGWGGHSGWGGICQEHSPKGLKIYLLGKQGEELENTFLKWPEVANRIADLIDDDNYLTEQDKKKYIEYRVEQNRLKEKAAEEQRQKNNLVKSVIVSASDERKQRILDEYAKTTQITEFGKFLFAEYGTNTESTDDYRVQYDAMGVWFTKYDTKGNTAFKVTLSWNEFAEKVCECIEDDNYIEAPEANEYDWDYLIDNAERGLSEITVSVGDVFLYKDKEVTIKELDSLYPGDVVIEYNEQTGNLKYAVTKNITEKELIQNGVRIKTATEQRISALVEYMVDYGTHNTEDGNSYLYFNDLPETEDFISDNAEAISYALERREEVADVAIIEEKEGNFFSVNFEIDYCPNIDEETRQEIEAESRDWDENKNTDLTDILNQTELGGAKQRFNNNIAAIKLVNKLYSENRNPTDAEKKVLARFVGWGGLSQAFDENNESWQKEYKELKELLPIADYEQAKGSTLNAYYTDKKVIDGIYAGLERLGVKGNNRILEPSMGTGNFFGFMPQEIANGSKLYGVELDNLTGMIATKLYPQANVQIKGFEDTSFPNCKFDVVVGNVPFGGYGVADSDYNRYNFKVHDYFLAKSIDKVKPNGLVAIVTSKGTMDKLNTSARKYVAERAELLGAIRLPNTAFKQTAGTEAVADILFFRKRNERKSDLTDEQWLSTGKTEEGFEINNYFIKHPEMVLGMLAEETGLYGGVDVTVKDDGRDLSEAIKTAIQNLPQGIYVNPEIAPEDDASEVDYNVKPMCYKTESGRLFMRVGEEMVEQPIPVFPKDAYQRIKAMIDLRESLHHILDIQIQGCSDEVLQREQIKLNAQYDRFVRQYGNINSQTNTRLFRDDGDSALLFACEDIDEETKAITKADIFNKRTIRPYVVPTSTDDCFEALQISKNERGKVDIAYIEELTGKDYDKVLFELGDTIFRNPDKVIAENEYSGFETAEEYLSGQVVDKLQRAKHYAAEHPEYQKNVAALEQVQPAPLTASEISVRLGATWVDKEYYKQFYCDLVGVYWHQYSDVELFYNPYDSSWRLDQKDGVRYNTQMKQKQVYGTTRAPAYRLFMDSMNQRATTIYDTVLDDDGKEKRVLNQAETIAAREKQNLIKEKFKEWIFNKPERREELEETYNRLFNRTRLPSYDGSYLKFPEMNPAIELKPHQKNAIHRIVTSPQSTLLHHVVGSGKTYTMAASIMKMRQLGLCKKAMVAVPNHLVRQWASEWRKLYPNAKLLIATKEDLEKDNRRQFVSKVAMGDWDGIIIAQSSFAKIPISYARQEKKLREEIHSIEETIARQWAENGMPRGAVKNLERIKKSRVAQLKKLMDDGKKDSVLDFESLGVDYLYIDEAHYYKNLFLFTKMNNVAGISNAASARASDLKLKCEYLQELHKNDKGVVFATGTPISNSMTEMYTMQTYLQPSTLEKAGITYFDGWAADFGETITSMELAPSGQGYRARTRFSKFTNLPELLTMYRSFADVQTADMVKLNVPEAERVVVNLKPSDTTIKLAEEIAARAERIYGGGVDSRIDNMLKVTSDGKKLALDPRCHIKGSEDEAESKLNECAQRIREIWEDTAESKGTQIVFCDLSTPKSRFEEYVYGTDFDAYNDLKYKLVQKGIPSNEIAFIHDANTEEQKQALFDSVNAGKIRVLIGSTEKCGAGTNVQKRLVALHHLDTPYRPSDLAQREGRIIRQGNTNDKVKIFTYVTERTFDSYSYQILENKQRFIAQIDRGDLTVREAEDIDETTLTYAEIKAITAANPKIKRKMEVDAEIARLRVLEGQYKKNLYSLQDKIRKDYPEDIKRQELLIERVQRDKELIPTNYADPEAFSISVQGTVYTDRKEGGKALTEALYASKPETVVAEYCGFKISINPMSALTNEREITLTGEGQYVIGISDSASGNLTRLDNFIEDFPKREERLKNRLKQLNDDLAIAKEQVEKPFEHTEHLQELISEQTQLNTELNLDKQEEVITDDESSDIDDGYYRALPTYSKAVTEVEMIDKEDKAAEISVIVLPDYDVSSGDMHEYGYTWDGMLPLKRQTALRLWGMGLQVYKLNSNDTETEIAKYEDLDDEHGLYGIEKPLWKRFCEHEKSVAYFAAKHEFADAAAIVTSGEMDYVESSNLENFINQNFEERYDLESYLADKGTPDSKELIAYTQMFLTDYSKRIWTEKLKEYGWIESDIPRALMRRLKNEEMQKCVKEIILSENQTTKVTEVTKESSTRNFLPVYLKSSEYAMEHGELDLFNTSHRASVECLKDISGAINENYHDNTLNKGFENELIEKHGIDRIKYVLATVIQEHEWDGRYSKQNKEWAKTIPISESAIESGRLNTNTHQGLIDLFTDRIRKMEKTMERTANQAFNFDSITRADKQVYYSVVLQIGEDKKPAYNAYILNRETGVLEYFDGNYSSDIALAATVEQTADWLYPEYQFIEKQPPELLGMSNNILRRLKLGEFEYGGYRFVPYREFNDKEKAMSLKEMTPYLSSDSGLGIAKSNIPYSEYDYDREDFYSASGNSKCDLFICKENGKIYVPTENELQIYNEKFNEKDKEIREFLTTVDNALADSEKPKIYYSFDRLKDENGLEYYQAFTMGDDGVIEPVFQDKLKTRQELNSRWKNLEVLFLPTQLVRITLEEMKTLSEKFNIENNKKIEENEMEDKDKYLTETPQGYKVLSIIKDRDDRNIAIIQRKNDFVVAARYDTSDGTWGQGTYDFPTVEAAEQYRGEHYGNAARQDNSKWVEINVSKNALIKRYDRSSHFRMPTTNKELQEYSYYLFNNRIKESRQLVDMQSDGRELCYKLLFEADDTVIIKNRNGDVREFTPQEFKELVGGTSNKDYESNFNKVKINLPREAIIGTYDKTTFIAMPTNNEKYKGYGYYVPNSVIEEDKESENGRINVSVGDNFKFTLKKGEEKKEITAEYLSDMVSGTNAEDYEREPTALDDYREQDGDEGDKKWFNVPFSEKAFIIEYDNVALYKMPKGEYEGKAYYLPHGMYKEKANGEVYLRIPEDFEIHLKGGADGEQIDLTAEQFIEALKGKTDEDYESKYRQPSEEAKKQFEKVEARLRKNVPEVMRNKPNWVIVRTRENMETGRLDKFLIDTHTGKFAESNNPETWTDFDTAYKYAKENGGVALAYALDGKDNIACIDLDGCIEKNGDFSPLAKKVFDNCDGTYCEKSVSGKGLHFFGITKGADLRAFSKDGDMEYYQGGHFIAMTGDDYGNTELKSFDTPEMKAILESKLEKRTEWKGAGTGVEGLSLLDDREVLDKAFASKNGEKIRQLYNGRDLQNNHSNSDMSLMNYLAFWCNHDIDQMLRINATSGLFRADKPQSYYEHTAIKAVKGTPVYTPPKASNNKPSGNGNGSDKGGK